MTPSDWSRYQRQKQANAGQHHVSNNIDVRLSHGSRPSNEIHHNQSKQTSKGQRNPAKLFIRKQPCQCIVALVQFKWLFKDRPNIGSGFDRFVTTELDALRILHIIRNQRSNLFAHDRFHDVSVFAEVEHHQWQVVLHAM